MEEAFELAGFAGACSPPSPDSWFASGGARRLAVTDLDRVVITTDGCRTLVTADGALALAADLALPGGLELPETDRVFALAAAKGTWRLPASDFC